MTRFVLGLTLIAALVATSWGQEDTKAKSKDKGTASRARDRLDKRPGHKPPADEPEAAPTSGALPAGERAVVAVLDFANRSDHQGRFYEVRAADALQLALADGGRFAPGPRKLVRREITNRGLAPPFDAATVKLVAGLLGAQIVVQGTIERCDVRPAERKCDVREVLDLYDGATGKPLTKLADSVSVTDAAETAPLLEGLVDAAFQGVASKLAATMARTRLTASPAPTAPVAPPVGPEAKGEPKTSASRTRRGVISLAEYRARQEKEGATAEPPAATAAQEETEREPVRSAAPLPAPEEEPGRPVRGVVLTSLPDGNRYLLSFREQRGAYKGMEVSVFHGSELTTPIGKLKIVGVDRSTCMAVPIGKVSGIQRGDHVMGRPPKGAAPGERD